MREYYVYIMTNGARTLYIGVTNDLMRRVYEHKQKLTDGFAKKYNITMLIYYETTDDVRSAIAREKQLKLDFTQNLERAMDALALARRHLWLASGGFSLSAADTDVQELPVALYHPLSDSLAHAA